MKTILPWKTSSLWLLITLAFAMPSASALNPADVHIENKSGPYFILDRDNPCQLEPGAAYVAYQICNLKSEPLKGVTADLSGLSNGFALAGGQVAQQEIGEMAAGECRMVYWYMGYPCDDDLNTDMTITVSDDNPGTVTKTSEIGLTESKRSGAGAKPNWMGVGTYFTEHGEICVDVEYKFKNVKKDKVAYFQPAGNIDFDAECLQLTRFTVMESGVSGIPEGEGEGFHYVMPSKVEGTKYAYVRFYFKVNCQTFNANVEPFASATSGNTQLKHNGSSVSTQIDLPGDLALPCDFVNGPAFSLNQSFGDSEGNNWGMAWGDYNNDGYPDLFVTTNDENQPNELYKNNGDGSFTQITTGAIATDLGPSLAATWGDYDNDGDLDLFVSNNIGYPNFLYRNEGGGNFVSIQGDAIVKDLGYAHGASWADYDNDGDLDLFVTTYWETEFNKLYQNNGDGTFSDVTNNPIVNEASRSVSGVWADYDNDGWQDLFVANLEGRNNSLYRNLGNGDFEKITDVEMVSDGGWSVGGSWGDFDNDGYLDLFVANASDEANYLYHNNGDGTFTKVLSGEIASDKAHTHGSSWGDFDNDGDLDLFVANDGDDNALYVNNGDGSFTSEYNELTVDGGLSFGSAWADMDRDGDLDLFVANRNGEANFLYENEKWGCHNFACIKLKGTRSNSLAVGARVVVEAEIDGQIVEQTRHISAQTGGGTGGQNEIAAHFGIGDADIIKSIKVYWPSGYQQELTNEPINQCIEIEEENGSLISGYVYYVDKINCSDNSVGGGTLPAGAQAADFRTVKDGDWDKSSTWLNGNKPPLSSETAELSGVTVSIEHDVEFEGNIKIYNNAKLWITNASLKLEDGYFRMNAAEVNLQGAELLIEDSYFWGTSTEGIFNARQSIIKVDGDFENYTAFDLEDVCFEVEDGEFYHAFNTFRLVNSIVSVDDYCNFVYPTLHIEDSKIHVEEGNLTVYSSVPVTGSGAVIWVEDGHFGVNSSNWEAGISQYCVDGQISGLSIPVAENCSDIEDYFEDDACSDMLVQGTNTVGTNNTGDENRIPIPNTRVVIQPGDITLYTDEDGYYSANVPMGNCEVTVHPDDNWETLCPSPEGMIEVDVNELGAEFGNNDFGHEGACTLPDMQVELAVTAHRVGFENLMVINYENIGATLGEDVQLLLSLGDGITPVESSVPWSGLAATLLIWDLADLEAGENGAIYLTYIVDDNVSVGAPIEMSANLSCVNNDCDVENDTYLLTGEAVGGIDPNDILVSPEGGIKREQELSYKIRFQNVGNSTTAHVRIENELPEALDMSTLEIGIASHTYQFRAEGNKLVWDFPAINLPDSLSNEPGSHGFVTYRIKPKADLAVGEKFFNGASIFFDNFDPIITNRVSNFILAKPQNGGELNALFIYPNPATSMVTVQFVQPEFLTGDVNLQTVEVFDPIGRLVRRQHQENGYRMQLDLSGNAPGLYTFHGIDDQGRRFIGKVIVAAE